MKEGFDREIDSLLRRRARGTAESRPWGDGLHGAHLDADELGAFAEGALPAAARVAAASHLADCERCRGVVVGLAPAARAAEAGSHAVAAHAAAETARPSAWRAFLASLFSPRAMRFAVPVLALSLVGVVSYVALRSKNGGAPETTRSVRPQGGTAQVGAGAPAAPNTGTSASNLEQAATLNSNAVPREEPVAVVQPAPRGHGAADAQPADDEANRDEVQPVAPPPPAPPAAAAAEGPAEMSKAAQRPVTTGEGEVARVENRDRADSKEKSARGSEPAEEYMSNDAAVQQRRNQSRVNEVQMPDGGSPRNQQRRAADNSSVYGGGASASATARDEGRERAGTRSEAVGRARAVRQGEKKAEEDAPARSGDTRTAAGHRFRREGGAWVDVNYRPSMASTGVRRGTEAFRALVADVPEVGRVAEAIGGEVVVVVNGRAYRIR